MGDWTNSEISRWTLYVWQSCFEEIAEKAKEGLSLDDDGKVETLNQIRKLATKYAKEIKDYK